MKGGKGPRWKRENDGRERARGNTQAIMWLEEAMAVVQAESDSAQSHLGTPELSQVPSARASMDTAAREEQHKSQCQDNCADLRAATPRPKHPISAGRFWHIIFRSPGLTRCWPHRGTMHSWVLAHSTGSGRSELWLMQIISQGWFEPVFDENWCPFWRNPPVHALRCKDSSPTGYSKQFQP